MISYEPLWRTMKEKSVTTYALINKHNIRKSTIDRLRQKKNVTIFTLARLCEILDCRIEDVVEYQKGKE